MVIEIEEKKKWVGDRKGLGALLYPEREKKVP